MVVKVNKEAATRRQLETAAEMFLCDMDLLPIYNVASGVLMITENLAENDAQSRDQTFFGFLRSQLTDEEFKSMKSALGNIAGHLKHARRGHEEEFSDVNEEQTSALIVLAIGNFEHVFGYITKPMEIFKGYFITTLKQELTPRLNLSEDKLQLLQHEREKGSNFLKQAALDGFYRAKNIDIRETTIAQIVLNP